MPGVIAGSVIRVELLPGPRVFDLVVASVLLPLGTWLALARRPLSRHAPRGCSRSFTMARSPPTGPSASPWGVGGLADAYTGARIQSRLPDALIRRLVGIVVIAIGTQYLWSSLG